MINLDFAHNLNRQVFMNLADVKENKNYIAHLMMQSIIYNSNLFGASKLNPMIISLEGGSWRKKYYLDNRSKFKDIEKESYKGKREKSADIPWDDIYEVVNDVLDYLDKYSDFQIIKVKDAEADDIIAVSSQYYKNKGETVWVVSSDKDFLQIQDEPIVNIYDPIKRLFKPKTDIERWKKIHVLIGDEADNIPKVKPRLGEKTAIKLLPELDTLLQTNHEFRERYRFNEVLIDFDHIPDEIRSAITKKLEEPFLNYNQMGLLELCSKYQLNKVSQNIRTFKLSDVEMKTKTNTTFDRIKKLEAEKQSSLEEFFS